MKDLLQLDREVCNGDTYHGTRMDQKALTFHTRLHEWSEAQNHINAQTQMLAANRTTVVLLPVKKLAQIETWTRQVNRFYKPARNARPRSGSFMKIDVTKYNMKVDQTEEARSRSAVYPRGRAHSAISRGTATTFGGKKSFFGNDVNTVRNNLFDTQMFYAGERRDIRSATTRKSTKSVKTEDFRTDVVTAVSETGKSVTNGIVDNDSDSLTIIDHNDDGSDLESESAVNNKMQPQIVARSYSNKELNVISIDDCKLTCRYRPQIIKENRILEDQESDCEEHAPSTQRVKHKATTDKVADTQAEANGNEADDEKSTDTVETIEKGVARLVIHTVDTNNNSNNNNIDACHSRSSEHNKSRKESNSLSDKSDYSSSLSQGGQNKPDRNISKSADIRVRDSDRNSSGRRVNFSSRGSSKSYGRVTNICSNQESPKPDKKVKQDTRSGRINSAINNVVQNRKVMNSMEKDFDTRTAVYGRTVVEASEGSEKFKKLHASLRKKMDQYVDTHSAIDTKGYYEKLQKSSAIS
ncbi:uncharacterized protein LOC128220338 isoform X2 [Mya arenaria]|nr:uncharacterized protein LOC128220338 isoform X2 [Mya arenaria]XP_052784675.1 uncharacterized protein LOC128220338 isoform X2 [Mya arenaria]